MSDTPKVPYGYYRLSTGTTVQNGDRIASHHCNVFQDCVASVGNNALSEFVYIRPIAIPEGWELLPETALVRRGDRFRYRSEWADSWANGTTVAHEHARNVLAGYPEGAYIRRKEAPEVPPTLPIPEGYCLLPPGEPLRHGDKVWNSCTRSFFPLNWGEVNGCVVCESNCFIRPLLPPSAPKPLFERFPVGFSFSYLGTQFVVTAHLPLYLPGSPEAIRAEYKDAAGHFATKEFSAAILNSLT